MDKLDCMLLAELAQNSTIPFSTIAKKFGISPSTIKKRYEKLRKDGILISKSMMIDLKQLGFEGKAFLFIKYSGCASLDLIKKQCLKIPNLFIFSDLIGGQFDSLAMVAFRDAQEIKEIADKLRDNNCVGQIKLAVTTDTIFPVKEEYLKNISTLFKK
jgi:DNA-binding Lrp family transcriptional regulator